MNNITIHGISRDINIPLKLYEVSKNRYLASSRFPIFLDDFNIELPKLLLIPIDNEIKVGVELLIEKQDLK